MGAWIETRKGISNHGTEKSLPAWERGLKRLIRRKKNTRIIVAPCVGAWIETLTVAVIISCNTVAPCVGAWIETIQLWKSAIPSLSLPAWERGLKQCGDHKDDLRTIVAPCVGAWIETCTSAERINRIFVAPCVGAWIETENGRNWHTLEFCRSLRGSVD